MRIPLCDGGMARKCLLSVAATCVFAWGAFADGESTERSQLSALLRAENNAGFELATRPRSFEFPRDHGPHPGFRNEWWYVTGNLDAHDGRRFGFELTFFRFALTPVAPESNSAWRSKQVFIAHFAVTDVDGGNFYVAERFSRGALGLAGAEAEPFRVWIDDWEIAAADNLKRREHWQLEASGDDFALSLQLVAEKSPVLNGDNGLSQKSAHVGNASYYYSISRWQTDGHLRLGKDEIKVSGLSWLDREWSSSALAADQQGWDWFALQLSDGSELMFYNLRKADGTRDVHSGGTWVAANGQSRHLDSNEVSILATSEWQSPEGGTYPSGWDIHAPGLGLSLTVAPVLDDQELFTTVRYWEGAVDVTGTRNGAEVIGRGYVELTGYAD
jgi:predicted secreted hydrolase